MRNMAAVRALVKAVDLEGTMIGGLLAIGRNTGMLRKKSSMHGLSRWRSVNL